MSADELIFERKDGTKVIKQNRTGEIEILDEVLKELIKQKEVVDGE